MMSTPVSFSSALRTGEQVRSGVAEASACRMIWLTASLRLLISGNAFEWLANMESSFAMHKCIIVISNNRATVTVIARKERK